MPNSPANNSCTAARSRSRRSGTVSVVAVMLMPVVTPCVAHGFSRAGAAPLKRCLRVCLQQLELLFHQCQLRADRVDEFVVFAREAVCVRRPAETGHYVG